MRTKFILLGLTIGTLVACAPAANASPYFGIRGGLGEVGADEDSTKMHEHENGVFTSAFIGYRLQAVRLEAEYTYRGKGKYADKSIELGSQSVMGNFYIEPPFKSWIHPYVNAGVGVTFFDTDDSLQSENSQDLTWSAGAGIGFEISRNVFLDIGYRYMVLGTAEVGTVELDVDTNEFYGGLRFHF